MEQYPTIKLIVEKGDTIARVVGVLPAIGGLALLLLGAHWFAVPVGVVTSAVLFFIMKSYVELVRVIADMLLPK